jgi:hypothetical protein
MRDFLHIYLLIVLLMSAHQTMWSQKDIKSKNTINHIVVKGTKVRMIPPKGFTEGVKFNGFKNSSTEASLVVVYSPVSFKESIIGITKAELEKQGLKNVLFKDIKVNSMPGLYVTGRQSVYGIEFDKIVLFFGNDKESVALSGFNDIRNVDEGKEILKSINSVYMDEKEAFDPFANLDYYFSKPTLKFVKQVSTSVVYNVDGILPPKSIDITNLLASKSNTANEILDKSKFAKERLIQHPIIVDSTLTHNQLKINNLHAEEIVAVGKIKGGNVSAQFYQLIIFEEKGYYIIIGTTNQDYEKNISAFRNMGHSFMLKR